MNDTVFGKIIRRELPAEIVYEDEQFLAFLDSNPVAKGHTLLIPKQQFTWIHDVPDALVGSIFIKAKELINALRAAIPCDYVQIGVVGNEVPHFHIHLIPRRIDEVVIQTNRPHIPYASDQEMKDYAKKISVKLQ